MQILDNASHMFCGTRTFIRFNNIWDRAGFPNLTMIDPQGGVAELGEKIIGVGRKHQNAGAFHQLLEASPGLGHEGGIHRPDSFVEKQNFGFNGGYHPQGQPNAHAGGIGAQRHGKVFAEFGKIGDFIHFLLHLFPGLAEE